MKLSRKQLAQLVGTSESQIQKLENGDRSLSQAWMVKLAAQLNCTAADLLPIRSHEAVMGRAAVVLFAYLLRILSTIKIPQATINQIEWFSLGVSTGNDIIEILRLLRSTPVGDQELVAETKACLFISKMATDYSSLERNDEWKYVERINDNFKPLAAKNLEFIKQSLLSAHAEFQARYASAAVGISRKPVIQKDGSIVAKWRPQEVVARIVPTIGRLAYGPWLKTSPPYLVDLTDPTNVYADDGVSRDAFGLEIIDDRYGVYRPGQTVVIDPRQAPKNEQDVLICDRSPDETETAVFLARYQQPANKPPAGKEGKFFWVKTWDRKKEWVRTKLHVDRHQILGPVVILRDPGFRFPPEA